MKKIRRQFCKVFALVLILTLSINTVAFASYKNNISSNSDDRLSINELYYNIFIDCSTTPCNTIEDDYDIYAYLIQNKEYLTNSSPLIFSDKLYVNLEDYQKDLIYDFLSRVNTLIDLNAIDVDCNLMFTMPTAPEIQNIPTPYALTINIMNDARAHADELKKVYDNAPFGTRHIVAGTYFTERVKSGGIWDYKNYLGVTTRFYEEELDTYMTGETIGNFHYGYVGSAVFSPSVLKAAGLAQITDGTTSLDYWNSYFDDPRDQNDIQWGIDQYNREH